LKTLIMLGLILLLPVSALAQGIDALVVDETEGFTESLAVNAIVGLLRQQTGLFASVDAVITSVQSPYDLPFAENPTGKQYDLVIVVPKGVLELGELWLVTAPYPQNDEALWAALAFARALAERFGAQFDLSLRLLDVNQSAFAGILSGYFARLGVLRASNAPPGPASMATP